MPFKRITHGKEKGNYRSESGEIYTPKQLKLYHATNGFKPETMKKMKRLGK